MATIDGPEVVPPAMRYEQLEESREQCRDRFGRAQPFPHLVIDELFEPDQIRVAAGTFPGPSEMAPKPGRQGVLECADRQLLPPLLWQISDELLGQRFVAWLSGVSGVAELRTDPGANWGALRQSGDDVEGGVHIAPAQPENSPLFRRLTLILHLSEGLGEDDGGFFQLWDQDKVAPRTCIAPLFNRAVVFLNIPTAYHNASRTHLGPGRTRKTMQILYFTEGPP